MYRCKTPKQISIFGNVWLPIDECVFSATSKKTQTNPIKGAIKTHLKTQELIEDSRVFEYLLFLIYEYTTNPPERNSINLLYGKTADKFNVHADSVDRALKRANLKPSPKKFIIHIASKIREEYHL